MIVALGHATEDLAVEVVEGRKQGEGAVAHEVMRAGTDRANAQRQPWLCAFQGLALRLLVAAQHQCPVRRGQIQPDHVPELDLEVLVARELEGPQTVRLDVVGAPDSLHLRGRDLRVLRHRAHAPARAPDRRLHGLGDHALNRLRRNRGLAAAPFGVLQPGKALTAKAALPKADHGTVHADLACRLFLGLALGTQQHDARPA